MFALELEIIAERPEALKVHLIRSTAGLPSLEHPAGRSLAIVIFGSFDLLESQYLEAQILGCANLPSKLIAK